MPPAETEKRRERKERDPKEAKERKERRERKERSGEKDDKAKTHKLSLKGSARLVAEFVSTRSLFSGVVGSDGKGMSC